MSDVTPRRVVSDPRYGRVLLDGRFADHDLNDGEYHEYTDRTEQRANAELIALAPELAAAVLAWQDCANVLHVECRCADTLDDIAERLRMIGVDE
jgi:hypothetical protein